MDTIDRSQAAMIATLEDLERRALWLSSWTIHHANHLRDSRDGLKVGGHQASCASSVTLLAALYGHALRPQDRIAVKPHAAPVMHAIMYLMGLQSRDALERFRGFGGAQSYPSRTKDKVPVDFSTGSVGLGVGMTLFASIAQDYLAAHKLLDGEPGRMIALMGDAELDEGNVFEALLEGWKHDVRNLWWVIDYNRHSLDGVVSDLLFQKIQSFYATVGWDVVLLKYGKRLEAAFAAPGGAALQHWIDHCPNDLYSALTFEGGAGFRRELEATLSDDAGIRRLLASHDDASLHRLMTNLGGHDMATVVEAFDAASANEQPTCFVAYTIKGMGLPFAGHKDNHAGLMTEAQMEAFRKTQGIKPGEEWERFAGLSPAATRQLRAFVDGLPKKLGLPRGAAHAASLAMPVLAPSATDHASTQEGFGRLLFELAKSDSALARRVVTTSPDVTVSTNLGGWVNQVGLFARAPHGDVFRDRKLPSIQRWVHSPQGRHIELGIAENNLFLSLAALGLAEPVFGARLLPIGTVYDPFIERGLDALNTPAIRMRASCSWRRPRASRSPPKAARINRSSRRSSVSASRASPCSSRLSSTNCTRSWAGPSSISSAMTAARSISASRRARSISRAASSIQRSRRKAAIGYANRVSLRTSPSSASARLRPKRSRPSRGSASIIRASGCWS